MMQRNSQFKIEKLESRRLLAFEPGTAPGVVFDLPDEITFLRDGQIVAAEYLDLNGDAKNDVVYTTNLNSNLNIAIAGSEGFQPWQTEPLPEKITQLKALDFNKDGSDDKIGFNLYNTASTAIKSETHTGKTYDDVSASYQMYLCGGESTNDSATFYNFYDCDPNYGG